MKRVLFGMMLCIATSALAFGGIGIGPWQRHKHQGADIIGVHIDIDGKGKDIPLECPEGSKLNPTTGLCMCEANYKMDGNLCVPATPATCEAEGKYWCASLQTCVADEATCLAQCPTERLCGSTCCGEGNVCVDGNKCCYQDITGNVDSSMCCDANESMGYSTVASSCCETGTSAFIYRKIPDESLETSCCAGAVITAPTIVKNAVSQLCCNNTPYKGIGYRGADVCCDHEPTIYTDIEEETFKVCWDEGTNCESHNNCDDGYYCNLTSTTGYYPKKGVCTEIGDISNTAEIDGLGTLIKSPATMSYWSAKDWCEAQGKSLIEASDFQCYYSETNNKFVDWEGSTTACCAENKSCSASNNWFKDEYKENYSERIYNILFGFGTKFTAWVASKHQPQGTYYRIRVLLSQAFMTTRQQSADDSTYAICK